ncbi:alpha-1,6-mannosyltransferase [Novosphingobium kunmingense]|uniref:Alpha-1,6-mannosyltransferase n=1 Tax=Novosphingobium kunmingense TaxID=1211806 RepID=A0A2N0HK45_9SPHN|nr:glycosyltransferase [Novosphingobium kunmingense]PKB19326.1 alpha-1,6-mannosyltransferase [Novosphingobium kunmingense]
MRIVDVCAFYSPQGGGVKTYVEQKLRLGPELGHEIVILAPGDKREVIERGPGARIVTLPSPRFPLDRKYWYFDDEHALHAELDALAPDFVEASSPWRSPSFVARWPSSVPRALVMHADPLSAYAYRWFEPLFSRELIDRQFKTFWEHIRELGDRYDRVVCASRELQERLRDGGVANTVLHPMGVEEGLFSKERRDRQVRRHLLELCDLPEDATLLIGVGRLSAEKRWPLVVDAVMAASNRHPIGLVILGDGNKRSRIVKQLFGNPHIRLLTPERDRGRFATILASADALIHGGEAETFCLGAAEARASGIPVIVPDRGGAADHAADGAGLTYAAGSAESAAEAILRLIEGPPLPLDEVPPSETMRGHFAKLFADYAGLVEGRRAVA